MLGFVHAALFVAAFPPLNVWPLAYVAVAPLAWLAIRAPSTRIAMLATFISQFAMWLWLCRWIIPISVPGYPALCLYQSVFAALFVWIVRRVERHRTLGWWPMTLVVPIVWTGIEFLRGSVAFDGYPWYLLSHPTIAWLALAQSADLGGTYLLSFLVAMVAGAIIDLLRCSSPREHWRLLTSFVGLVLLVHVANIGYGLWRVSQSEPLAPGPRVLAVQTDLPQDNKNAWTAEEQATDLPHFIELTRDGLAEAGKVDLIVWPETMVPGPGFEPATLEWFEQRGADAFTRWPRALIDLARELDTPLLVGSLAWIEPAIIDGPSGRTVEAQREYNSAFLLAPGGDSQRYDKVFLTPFGETMPYISNWPWLEERLLALGAKGMSFSLDRDPEIELLTMSWRGASSSSPNPQAPSLSIATPICFEDTVSSVCRQMAYRDGEKAIDLFVNLSNDGWFGSFDAGRAQHVQIARFRCIENRIPMVRAANTGLSVSIDSRGELIGAIGPGRAGAPRQAGSLLAVTTLDARHTLFSRIGDLWGWLMLAAALILVLWSFRHPAREKLE